LLVVLDGIHSQRVIYIVDLAVVGWGSSALFTMLHCRTRAAYINV